MHLLKGSNTPVLVMGVRTAGTVCLRDSMVLYAVEIEHI